MSDLLLDLVQYLTSEGLVQGDGVDAFRDFSPDQPDNVVVLYEYAGMPTRAGDESSDRNVQITVRNVNPAQARQKIHQIFNLLDTPLERIHDVTVSRWAVMYARQTPFKLRVDEKGRHIYALNLGVTTHRDA